MVKKQIRLHNLKVISFIFSQFLALVKFQDKVSNDCVVINLCIIIQNVQKVRKAQSTSLQRLPYAQKVQGQLM